MQHRVIDPAHQSMIVAAFEHPDTWRAGSTVSWNRQHTSHPVVLQAATWDPAAPCSFEFLPVEACYWLEPNYGMHPIGQGRFGLILLPPAPAVEVVTRWLIPRHRGNRPGLRLVSAQPVPDLARTLNATELRDLPTEGAMARVEYTEGAHAFAEEFYACRYQLPPVPGAVTQINWGLIRVFCFRAEPGRLDALRGTFFRIATSMYYNPAWQTLYQQVTAQLNGQFQQQIQAGFDKLRDEANFQQQLTAYYQGQRDRQSADIASGIERQRQRSSAPAPGAYSAQDAWADGALQNRTAYEDPSNRAGNFHYDYGNHDYVWTDNQGNYIGKDDPNFDPNVGSDRTWTRAKKLRGP